MNLGSAMRCFERELDAAVNCEVLHPAFMESKALALAPDQYLHDTAFCRASKLAAGGICFANKARSKQIAALGRPFSGCCPNGVWDYAQPVIFEGRPAAVFYLGLLLRLRRGGEWITSRSRRGTEAGDSGCGAVPEKVRPAGADALAGVPPRQAKKA